MMYLIWATGWLLLCMPFSILAQENIDRAELIKSLARNIHREYVSPGLAIMMEDSLTSKFNAGGYSDELNIHEFTYEITCDLRRISRDLHIKVTAPNRTEYTKAQKKFISKKSRLSLKELDADYAKRTGKDMFTYGDIKILPGNIGYVEIEKFSTTSYIPKENKGRIPMKSVFAFLRSTQAIIIDLRKNTGGSRMQSMNFCSYLAELPGSYFMSLSSSFRYDSLGVEKTFDSYEKHYMNKEINNDLTKGKKIFVLVGKETFSAAEIVAYKIKRLLPSATILGERTKGACNAYNSPIYDDNYIAIIPNQRVFDESNNNYSMETIGVSPDIIVPQDSTFQVAYRLSLSGQPAPVNQSPRYYKRKESPPVQSLPELDRYQPDYIGSYRKIIVKKAAQELVLVYDQITVNLEPVSKDIFKSEHFKSISFTRNTKGKVVAVEVKHFDGLLEIFSRQ